MNSLDAESAEIPISRQCLTYNLKSKKLLVKQIFNASTAYQTHLVTPYVFGPRGLEKSHMERMRMLIASLGVNQGFWYGVSGITRRNNDGNALISFHRIDSRRSVLPARALCLNSV